MTATGEPKAGKQPVHSKDGTNRLPRECEKLTAGSNTPTSTRPSASSCNTALRDPGSAEVSTLAVSTIDSSSERSEVDSRSSTENIQWHEMRLGHRIQPYRRYAHCLADIYLLSQFLDIAQLEDIDGDTVKLMLRALKLLRLCDYSVVDICSIMAHTSCYFIDAYALCGNHMDAKEVGNVIVTLMFIAHSYVQDETCPLRVWHQHLFKRYCPLKTLSAAIMRLLEIRNHVLRVEEKEHMRCYNSLIQAVQKHGVHNTGLEAGNIESGSTASSASKS
eukprot:gnl/TRDRNA2_/TRDRNA2_69565_c0_seq1.p1 gnl/TRDRNA2_/TRDRNA2_69565_c0~~gnl/TRDRNA2_/TRDRNA2_69565_c0_seq1.p1  ORF type:complete len:297 (-),score=36.28 gnl/TRDRNA2_/TRDRNA2_69565_c0_seq1:111-938(-)